MLITLDSLIARGVEPSSVLHVGAHLAEEADEYQRLGMSPVFWVEANPDLMPALVRKLHPIPKQFLIIAAVSSGKRETVFHVASNGQSSSLLEFELHRDEHPDVHYVKDQDVTTTTLDELWAEGLLQPTGFLNLDVQGSELDVLVGGEKYLEHVRTVYSEVNEKELYRGCALFDQMDAWLSERGFRLLDKQMTAHFWGDACWIRS